jgi:cell division septum initiation protein DivIVA
METSQRSQAEAGLEKARADASAAEQIHSKLRQESEALRRDLEEKAKALAAQVETLQSELSAAMAEHGKSGAKSPGGSPARRPSAPK